VPASFLSFFITSRNGEDVEKNTTGFGAEEELNSRLSILCGNPETLGNDDGLLCNGNSLELAIYRINWGI
jgi:hypothetical protein